MGEAVTSETPAKSAGSNIECIFKRVSADQDATAKVETVRGKQERVEEDKSLLSSMYLFFHGRFQALMINRSLPNEDEGFVSVLHYSSIVELGSG
jgi:hypothetical protein